MTRKECLDKAAECVLQDRASQYGSVEDNFACIAQMWNAYLGISGIKPWDVAAMMALLKVARLRANPGRDDSWVDLAGYAACGAECRQKFETEMKKTIEDAFETFPHLKLRAEGEVKDEAEAEAKGMVDLAFKPGDPVEWFSFRREDAATGWRPAFYLGKAGDPDYRVVQDADGTRHIVNCANIRSPKAKYRPGDKVQVQRTCHREWENAVYVMSHPSGFGHIVRHPDDGRIAIDVERVRPAPQAEGCEELVQKDAPRTPDELCQRIVDCNPATFRPRTPTGEELAEMAREDAHG